MAEKRNRPVAEFPIPKSPVAEFGERRLVIARIIDAPCDPHRGGWSSTLDLLVEHLATL